MIHDKYNNEDSHIYINGNDDPFGINDVLIKMAEIMDERYGLFSIEDTDEPVVVDFTVLSDNEMSELIREAVACVEFENEFMGQTYVGVAASHYLS